MNALRLAAAVLLVLPCLPAVAGENASEQLSALIEEDWRYRLDEDPLFATQVGDPTGNDRLPAVGLQDHRRRQDHRVAMLERLAAIDPVTLDAERRIDYDIFKRLKQDQVAEYRFGAYLIPITNRSGFHVEFAELGARVPLDDLRDYENYLSRLRQFERYAAQHVELMRAGIEQGRVLPAVVLDGWEGSIDPHIVEDPQESLLFGPLRTMPKTIPTAEAERLRGAAREAIRDSVVPGYRAFRTFMAEEYVPAARSTIGAAQLPDGRAFYEHRVRRFTTLPLTPEEVHEIGVQEVARIRAEMEQVIRRAGFGGTLPEFLHFLRRDSQFYATDAEELLKIVSRVLKRMDGHLPELFRTLPRMPYGVLPVPDYIAPKTSTAYYNPPAGDGSRAGFYYVNTHNLRSRPLYEIEALSLHEAVPGHHLQMALQQEQTRLPAFRRFDGFTVFVEGWALYAERLGLEVGFYQDPYSNFGRLTYEMWRACRLVVDPGMHALGWTRGQAIAFMTQNTALSRHNITTEVDRYIAWPGQALAYKIGELKIRELRGLAEAELGDRFDLRAFHDAVLLDGSVPLDVLERNVRRFIEASGGSGEPASAAAGL